MTRFARTLAMAGWCVMAAAATQAHGAVGTDFPPGAQPLSGDALQAQIAGRVFRTTDGQQRQWRLEYSRLGHFFVDIAPSYQDSGPYRVDGTRVCVELRKTGASCAEYRVQGDTVYIKRTSNGEILTLAPQ